MAYDPVDLVEEQSQLQAHRVAFVLWPRQWKRFRIRRKLDWRTQSLHPDKKGRVSNTSGIYTLVIKPSIAQHPACSYVMYVGQAENLRSRFNSYCTQERRIRPRIVRMLYSWDGFVYFCACSVPRNQLKRVEDALIESYVPPANSDYPATLRAAIKAF